MAEKKEFKVQAKQREGRGKNDSRRARREGLVPITVYGGGAETLAAVAPLRDLAAILRSESGRNTIFTIDVEGVGPSEVMFHDCLLYTSPSPGDTERSRMPSSA